MFDNHFEVYLADTEESKNIHYSIRYQVYCDEMGFENGADFPLERECDENDKKSIHLIVKNKLTNKWVGAMRLIYRHNDLLPIEEACQLTEDITPTDFFETVEISRLCIVKDARRGIDVDPPHGLPDESNPLEEKEENSNVTEIPSQNKLNRLIIWGLFHATSEYCYNNRIHHCYFMTTAILGKVMRRGGLNLVNIGEPCEHRGERFPFKIDAIKTYQDEMWNNGFNDSYILYSESKKSQSLKVA